MKKLRERLARFFFPTPNSPRWMLVLPYATLGILTLILLAGGFDHRAHVLIRRALTFVEYLGRLASAGIGG